MSIKPLSQQIGSEIWNPPASRCNGKCNSISFRNKANYLQVNMFDTFFELFEEKICYYLKVDLTDRFL